MKKAIYIAVAVLLVLYLGSQYNSMIEMREGVNSQWSQVENVYQRRADLIPNLVATVKGYADFEQETLTAVVEARAKATSINVDPSKLDANSIQQFQSAQDGLSSALARLMVVVEKYPDLKANQNFLELQSQLEGSENRITVERKKFNSDAKDYNSYIQAVHRLPVAKIGGFERIDYFQASAGAEEAPKVEF